MPHKSKPQGTVVLQHSCAPRLLAFLLQERPHKRIDADELQLNVITVKGDPSAIRELLDHNAIFLRQEAGQPGCHHPQSCPEPLVSLAGTPSHSSAWGHPSLHPDHSTRKWARCARASLLPPSLLSCPPAPTSLAYPFSSSRPDSNVSLVNPAPSSVHWQSPPTPALPRQTHTPSKVSLDSGLCARHSAPPLTLLGVEMNFFFLRPLSPSQKCAKKAFKLKQLGQNPRGPPAPRPSYHQVSDSIGVGWGRLTHPMVGHRPHTEDPFLLEHPAGKGHSKLVVACLGIPAEGENERPEH